MTDATTQTQTTTTPPPPPPPPAVDTEAIATQAAAKVKDTVLKEVNASAAKAAEEGVAKALKRLAGTEDDKPKVDPLAPKFLQETTQMLKEVVDVAVETAEQKIEARQVEKAEKKAQNEHTFRSTAEPFVKEYPEINKYSELVEAQISSELQKGKSLQEAVKGGFETIINKLGLKSVKTLAEERKLRRGGIPPLSTPARTSSAEPEFDDAKSTSDYITGLRARHRKTIASAED